MNPNPHPNPNSNPNPNRIQRQLPPPQPRRPNRPPVQHTRQNQTRAHQPIDFTENERITIQTKLNKALGPEYVSSRPGGHGAVQYIEGWKALNLANEIFGFNGWNSELVSCEIDFFDTHGNTGKCSLGLSIVVRITLKDGTYHEDIGYGFIENARNKATAFEKCKKEAFTDGIKRCLRCFGNVLGNCLYDKTIVKQMEKVKKPPVEYQEEDFHRDRLLVERERKKELIERREAEAEAEAEANANANARANAKANAETNTNANSESWHLNANPNPNILINPHQAFVTPRLPSKVVDLPRKKDTDDVDDESFLFSDDLGDESQTSQQTLKMKDYEQLEAETMAKRKGRDDDDNRSGNNNKNYSSDNNNNNNSNSDYLAHAPAHAQARTHAHTHAPAPASGPSPSPASASIPSPMVAFVNAKSATLIQQNPEPSSQEIKRFDPNFVSPNIRRTVDPTKSVPIKRPDKAPTPPINTNHLQNRVHKPSTNPLNANFGKRIGLPPLKMNKRIHLDPLGNRPS